MAKKFSKPELSRKINGDLPTERVVIDETPRKRFDMLLLEQYPEYSRATIQKMIKCGYASLNGEVIKKANFLIDDNGEASVELNAPKSEQTDRPPVLYEDENMIVFNKPAGMLSIKKGAYLAEPAIDDFGEPVHRLDRDTSGIIVVAKNPEAKAKLQKQFSERKAHKSYYAVVVGHPTPEHAVISVPLTRNLKKPTTFIADANGREAVTEYKVIASNDKYSLVELKPRTGRTHQLRIHMAHIRTPILGDPVYNPKSPKADRMYLHATSLEITTPDGKRMTFTAPMPESFRDAVK